VTRDDWATPTGNISRTRSRRTGFCDVDDDFLSLVGGSGFEHAGIVYIQQAGRDIGDVVKTVDAHLESRSEDDRGIHHC
jgi:hypothetical protein